MTEPEKEAVRFMITEIDGKISQDFYQYHFFKSMAQQFRDLGRLSDKQLHWLKQIYERVTR